MKTDYEKSIESAQLLAQARIKAFERNNNPPVDEYEDIKRKIVKVILNDPKVFRETMKNFPNEMNNLIQRFGTK